MSRSDPLGLVSKATPIIRQLAAHIHAITRPSASTVWIGRGYSPPPGTEHPTGRALDIIISARVGILPNPREKKAAEAVLAWLIRHADALHIRHIIWDRRIWRRRYRGTAREWSKLTGRDGVSDWHLDHIHVYLDDAAGFVPPAPLYPITIEGTDDMNPDDLATAILRHPITANGKTEPLATHLGELFTLNRAQSVAVNTEQARDSANTAVILARLDRVLAAVEARP